MTVHKLENHPIINNVPEGWEKGYKGFDKDLECRKFPYEVGQWYSTGHTFIPKPCSDEGIHYCKTLLDATTFYSRGLESRYCEIYAGPKRSTEGAKSCATDIYIVRELTSPEIDKILIQDRDLVRINVIHKNIHLEELKQFLTEYPLAHVVGSLGLWLRGAKLKRVGATQDSDWDIVMPYFVPVKGSYANGNPYNGEEDFRSGSDFEYNTLYKGVKVDIAINPTERWDIITYDGFDFKVSRAIDILEKKIKYVKQGNLKHKDDINELLGVK